MLSVRGSARTKEMQVDILVAKDGRKRKKKVQIYLFAKKRKIKQHRIVLQGQ